MDASWELGRKTFNTTRDGTVEDVQRLLQQGANVLWRGYTGHTALHVAVVKNKLDVLELLLDLPHPDVNVRTDDGWAALHSAVTYDQVDALKLLVRCPNINLNIVAKDESTPLMEASLRGRYTCAELLLKAGADIKPINVNRKTARDIATEWGNHDIVWLIDNSLLPLPPFQNTIKDISGLNFSTDEKEKLTSCKILTLVPVGETMAGKTSVVRSLILRKSHLALPDERTVVAEVLGWIPENKQDIIFLVYDIGGNESYKATCHCFQMNSPSTVCLLCHDIMKENYEATFFWLKATQTNAPDSKVLVALTQIDRAGGNLESLTQKFVKTFTALIDREMQVTEFQKKNTQSPNLPLFDKHLENYRSVKQQLLSKQFFQLSCAPNYENRIERFRKWLIDFVEHSEDSTLTLRTVDRDLFIEIGTLGLKDPLIQHPEAPLNEKYTRIPDLESGVTDAARLSGSNLEASLNPQNTQERRSTPEPIYPQETRDEETEFLSQKYLTIGEVKDVFEVILRKHRVTVVDLEKETQHSLMNLSNKGLLSYFMGDEDLQRIVFNRISTLVNILRCIFHHRLKDLLQFNDLDYNLQEELYKNKQMLFNKDLEELDRFGVLSMDLLKVLLAKIHCSLEVDVVAKLLSRLDVGIIFTEDSIASKKYMLVPFFIQKTIEPDQLRKYKEDILRCDSQLLSLHTVLKGDFPDSFFHQLVVRVYNKFGRNQITDKQNQSWSEGVWIRLGKNRAKIMMHHNNAREIEFIVQADVTDVSGHLHMWECINFVNNTAKSLKSSKYPGLALDFVLKCTHCRLAIGNRDREDIYAYEWDIDIELLCNAANPVETYRCRRSERDIPPALLAPIPRDGSKNLMEEMQSYLREHDQSTRVHAVGSIHQHPAPHFTQTRQSTPSNFPTSSELMNVHVRHVTKTHHEITEFLELQKERIYQIYRRSRGRAVIINVQLFDNDHERRGSEYDATKLVNLFRQLHFDICRYDNPTAQEIQDILESESQRQTTDADAFILCILSHGNQDRNQDIICGSDWGVVYIKQEIYSKFNGSNCPELIGKPKVFILQSCRGGGKTRGVTVPDACVDAPPMRGHRVHELADFIFAHATISSGACYRDEDSGSWFIQHFVTVVSENAYKDHLEGMLKEVRRRIQSMQRTHVQITTEDQTLTKYLYFFPGYI